MHDEILIVVRMEFGICESDILSKFSLKKSTWKFFKTPTFLSNHFSAIAIFSFPKFLFFYTLSSKVGQKNCPRLDGCPKMNKLLSFIVEKLKMIIIYLKAYKLLTKSIFFVNLFKFLFYFFFQFYEERWCDRKS